MILKAIWHLHRKVVIRILLLNTLIRIVIPIYCCRCVIMYWMMCLRGEIELWLSVLWGWCKEMYDCSLRNKKSAQMIGVRCRASLIPLNGKASKRSKKTARPPFHQGQLRPNVSPWSVLRGLEGWWDWGKSINNSISDTKSHSINSLRVHGCRNVGSTWTWMPSAVE